MRRRRLRLACGLLGRARLGRQRPRGRPQQRHALAGGACDLVATASVRVSPPRAGRSRPPSAPRSDGRVRAARRPVSSIAAARSVWPRRSSTDAVPRLPSAARADVSSDRIAARSAFVASCELLGARLPGERPLLRLADALAGLEQRRHLLRLVAARAGSRPTRPSPACAASGSPPPPRPGVRASSREARSLRAFVNSSSGRL